MPLMLSFLFLLLGGCASLGNDSIMQKPADWPPLTMTKPQLIQELGPARSSATRVTEGKQTEVLVWLYAESVMFQAKAKVLSVEFEGDKMVARTWSQSGGQ